MWKGLVVGGLVCEDLWGGGVGERGDYDMLGFCLGKLAVCAYIFFHFLYITQNNY
jgi:hypothetical protein